MGNLIQSELSQAAQLEEAGYAISRSKGKQLSFNVKSLYNVHSNLPLPASFALTKPNGEKISIPLFSNGSASILFDVFDIEGSYTFQLEYPRTVPRSIKRIMNLSTETVGNQYTIEEPSPFVIEYEDKELFLRSSSADFSRIVSAEYNTIFYKFIPVWFGNRANWNVRASTDVVKYAVLHIAEIVSSTLHTFLAPGNPSTHYIIDTDGRLIKLIQDNYVSYHGNPSAWLADKDLNKFSIGIDLVPDAEQGYADIQYESLLELLDELKAKHPEFIGVNVLAHSDISANASRTSLNDDRYDPGRFFNWSKLTVRGYSIPSRRDADATTIYEGMFNQYPNLKIREGDSDSIKQYGGKTRSELANPTIIRQIQEDLRSIGFLVNVDGNFTYSTKMVVRAFKIHCFHIGNTTPMLEKKFYYSDLTVDQQTALRIRNYANIERP